MKINSKPLPFVLALAAEKSAKSVMRLELLRAHPVPMPQPPPSKRCCVEQADATDNNTSESITRNIADTTGF